MDNKEVYNIMVEHYGKEVTESYLRYIEEENKAMDALYNEVAQPKVMEELFNRINIRFKKDFGFRYELSTSAANERSMRICSTNLASRENRLLSAAWKEFYLGSSTCLNGFIKTKRTYTDQLAPIYEDIAKIDFSVPSVPYFFVALGYTYRSHDGGSNGTHVLKAIYKNGKWETVEFVEDKSEAYC